MTKKNLKRSKDTEIAQAAEEHHEIPISNDNFQQSYYPSNEDVALTQPNTTEAQHLNTEEARKRAKYQETTATYKKARKNIGKLFIFILLYCVSVIIIMCANFHLSI